MDNKAKIQIIAFIGLFVGVFMTFLGLLTLPKAEDIFILFSFKFAFFGALFTIISIVVLLTTLLKPKHKSKTDDSKSRTHD